MLNATHSQEQLAAEFARETARLRASGVLGESGRLLELFDFLASRGAKAEPASQAEIAEQVFGQSGVDSDDATVRVYIHRLRKRLQDHYDKRGEGAAGGQLAIPAGTYALRFLPEEREANDDDRNIPAGRHMLPGRMLIPGLVALAALLLVGGFVLGGAFGGGPEATRPNAIWKPFIESDRPIALVVGDYYMFGEIDPVRPEEGRLIRDFRINSPTDLVRAQQEQPERYDFAEDFGINYLPFAVSYGLQDIMPVLSRKAGDVSVVAASQVTSDIFRTHNVVYLGLVSGMGLLEEVNFRDSGIGLGPSYDELIDKETGRHYVSTEARNVASQNYYRDYGYLSVFREPSGALIAVVAGARDTGLRGISPIVVQHELPDAVEDLAESGESYELLYEITGQQGADLSEKLLLAASR